jgi:hypothetical protein
MNEMIECDDINYDDIAIHLPWVITSLYSDGVVDNYSLAEIRDALRIQQLQSKSWLYNHLKDLDRESKILVVGSWLGFTSYCLLKMGFKSIHETDTDPKHRKLSTWMNREFNKFCSISMDVNKIPLEFHDVIICTSCEHIENNEWFDRVIPKTKMFLQSTNLVLPDHINTVNSIEEFSEKYPLNLEYSGTMKYSDSFYRYMLVGEKM